MGGFGPASGRLVEACEEHEVRRIAKTRSVPPAIGAVATVALALSVMYGMTMVYDGEELVGTLVLLVSVAVGAFLILRSLRSSRIRA